VLNSIPYELQQLAQWVVSDKQGKFEKVPRNPRTGNFADVMDPGTWGTFAEACACHDKHVGFVLSKNDPYCIIDLDAPITQEQTKRHARILEAFETYAEFSQSGKGVHIICRGSVPAGARRDKVEVYSDSRYMICTGSAYRNLPIVDTQPLLNLLFHEMSKDRQTVVELVQQEGAFTDEQVYNMARDANNGDKFVKLWSGLWQGDYPSQSEADFALMSMLCFYSKDNEQCRRLFRWSGLAKDPSGNLRPKTFRDNKYVNYMLGKQRAKEAPPVDFTELLTRAEAVLKSKQEATCLAVVEQMTPPAEQYLEEKRKPKAIKMPPGLIGELAHYIKESAHRPVAEIGLVSAMALTAGIVGRSYNINGTGLNQYFILLAPTGTGKEGAARGMNGLIAAVRMQIPMVEQFLGPSAFASGQGLIRVLDEKICFVSVLGEFGLTLQQLCDPRANTAERLLKRALLDLYSKSGFNDILHGSAYADKDKNTKIIHAPSLTILGETTPGIFYDSLSHSLVSEGLVPRFSIIEYDGPRPPGNPRAGFPPDEALTNRFAELPAIALRTIQARTHCPVTLDINAARLMAEFDAYVDDQINADTVDAKRQLWNRAHLKALKLSALVSVGCNPHAPVINLECADWAIEMATSDVKRILRKFEGQEIGDGDARQEGDARRAILDWLNMSTKQRMGYRVNEKIAKSVIGIIPQFYLFKRLQMTASCANDRRGARFAIESLLKTLLANEVLIQIPHLQAAAEFGAKSPLFAVGPHF
jgi:hypothetical protein